MRSLTLETSAVWLALTLPCLACSSSSSGSSPADASTDAKGMMTEDSGPPDTSTPIPPPSNDCRFVDDEGITCNGMYYLPNAQLYTCGDLTTTDVIDAGIYRPYPPPPLPASVDCRNVAPPDVEAGAVTLQLGAQWCCLGDPSVCVPAAALNSACPGGSFALSCPTEQPVFPAATNDGGACVLLGSTPADAGPDGGDGGEGEDGGPPDTGLVLTPPQGAYETLWCCHT